MNYAVLTVLHNGRCEDCATVNGEPERFGTQDEAQAEINDMIDTWKAENPDECPLLGYTQDDFLIVHVSEIERHL